ncbi:MAG: DUF2206 domain-containing protein [Halobacteriota archaeon]|nr:DUF2206 domain-containing protein [Halobacteriota archaeon]
MKKKVLFFIFLFSVIISHYSTTYIYHFILITVVTISYALNRTHNSTIKLIKKRISLTTLLLFSVATFLWFGQITTSGFTSGTRFVFDTIRELNSIFLIESRSQSVQTFFGYQIIQRGIPYVIELVLTWVILITIVIGFLYILKHFIQGSLNSNKQGKKIINGVISTEYFALVFGCVGLLFLFVTLPFVSEGYGMTRIFSQVSVILSTVFIFGTLVLSEKIKVKPIILMMLIILPNFLSITGVTYQVFGDPRQIVLNSEGDLYDTYYIYDTEYASGQWYGLYSSYDTKVYTDSSGAEISSAIGSRIRSGPIGDNEKYLTYYFKILPFSEDAFEHLDGYVYLRYVNVISKKFEIKKIGYEDFSSNYSKLQVNSDKIYANGGSEIYYR